MGNRTATKRGFARAKHMKAMMGTKKDKASDEARIRQLIDDWAKAVRARDINGFMSHFAPDVLLFDLVTPLEYKGADAYRKNQEEWFATWQGPIGYEIRDLSITVGDDVAFNHSLNRISGTRTYGEKTDVWVRVTVCRRKINGKWLITHEHASVPFYMDGTYKAAVDLKP